MSNIIPPLVSSSPPPMVVGEPDDLDDDEFGDFAAAADISFEEYSLPTSPQHGAYSNFSTQNTFSNQKSNYIVSPGSNHLNIKENVSITTELCNGQNSHVEENVKKSAEYNIISEENSEHIFCDIKSDVIINSNDTAYVNNSSTEIKEDIILKQVQSSENSPKKKVIQENLEDVPSSNSQNESNQDTTTKLNPEKFNDNCDKIEKNTATNIINNTESLVEEENEEKLEEVVEQNDDEFGDFENFPPEKSSNKERLEKLEENDTEASIKIENNNILNVESHVGVEKLIENVGSLILETDKETVFNKCEQFENSTINVEIENINRCKEIEIESTKNKKITEKVKENMTEEFTDFKTEPFEETIPKEFTDFKAKSSAETSLEEFTDCKTEPSAETPSEEFTNFKTEPCAKTFPEEFTDFKTESSAKASPEEYTDFKSEPRAETLSEFGNFADFNTKIYEESLAFDPQETDDDFQEFTDFQVEHTAKKLETMTNESNNFKNIKSSEQNETLSDEEFGDFNDFSSATQIITKNKVAANQSSADFGDFSDYSSAPKETASDFIADFSISVNNDPAKIEKIIKNLFVFEEAEKSDCEFTDFVENELFQNVQDIENTIALSYHWVNSESQKMMLKALNIDSRNILFGPRWNASMPRFAANLGFTPLEPVKTDLASGSTVQSKSVSQPETVHCEEVPAAKFDWTSSGLVNPLDYTQANTMLLDLEQLVPNIDIPHITLPSSQNNSDHLSLDLDSWDYWLQMQSTDSSKQGTTENKSDLHQQLAISRQSPEGNTNIQIDLTVLNNLGNLSQSDNESVNSLKFIETPADIENEIKLEPDTNIINEKIQDNIGVEKDDFTSFQSSKSESSSWQSTGVKLQLRETHISNCPTTSQQNPGLNLQTFELESTIVTPDLPRKTIELQEIEEDDDFTDFQMSLPSNDKKKNEIINPISIEPLKPLEPLKPIVIETENVPTQINWPEPGIVSDDLNEFDFTFTTNNTKDINSISNVGKIAENAVNENVKVQEVVTNEEDDWSDFVCAQQSPSKAGVSKEAPVLKPVNKMSNAYQNIFQPQPASQLELSVPNLQNTQLSRTTVLPPAFIPNTSPTRTNSQPSTQQLAAQQITYGYQPPYQIPLQTINTPFGGLPQTSLSSYNNFTIGPTELSAQLNTNTTNVTNQFGLFDGPFNPEMKPFQSYNPPVHTALESQYQNNLNPTGYGFNSVESTFLKMLQPVQQNQDDDDDDWTDFVSSQPIPSDINGVSGTTSQIHTIQKSVGNHFATPNIITNPVHFEAFQSYQAVASLDNRNINYKRTDNTLNQPQMKNKSSVPSISALPELDFIAPKNKFFTKK